MATSQDVGCFLRLSLQGKMGGSDHNFTRPVTSFKDVQQVVRKPWGRGGVILQ